MSKMEAISINNLTVTTPLGQTILSDVSTSFEKGKITLLMGGSGAGKSVLARIIAGLVKDHKEGWQVSGTVTVQGKSLNQAAGSVSYIFQDYALFEDMTLEENLSIARDHSPNLLDEEEQGFLESRIREMLLPDVPRDVPVTRLSGGQKQRLAIARALVFNPDIVIFDEPNAGLDGVSARSLARLISEIRDRFNTTILIILHHTRHFTDIADKLYLVDPEKKGLIELPETTTEETLEDSIRGGRDDSRATKKPLTFTGRLNHLADITGQAVTDFIYSVGRYLFLPRFKRAKWGFRYLWYYQRMAGIFSFSSIIYMAMAGMIIGFVATYFVFELLPYKNILEPLLGTQLLRAVGYVLYRVAIPVIACILVAARGGAIISADIATRNYNRQLDAMETLGIPYKSYLLTAVLFTFVVHTPLLTALISFEASRLTSLMVYKWLKPESSYYYWYQWFHRSLVYDFPFYYGFLRVMSKTALSGLMVGYIAWRYGSKEKSSIEDVNQSITGTIVASTIAVLLVHFLFAFFEFTKNG